MSSAGIDETGGGGRPDSPCSVRFLIGLLIGLGLLQALVLHESFAIKPAADDFPYVDEFARGNAMGPLEFFRQSFTYQTYRPVASLGIWIALKLGPIDRPFSLRALGFFCMALYTASAGLWIYAARLSRLGAAIVALTLLFHPILPAALGSVDGFNAIFSCALLWLGGWGVYQFRERPIIASIWTFACLLIGAGAKEHAFALLFLAPLVALSFGSTQRRVRLSISVFVAATAAFGLMLIVRKLTMPPGQHGGLAFASFNPIQWVKNAALIVSGLLFCGNSVWVYVRHDLIAFALTGAAILIAVVMLFAGLKRQWSRNARWIVFALLATVAACFPVGIMLHISEMYLTPMLLPLALLVGFALSEMLQTKFFAALRPLIAVASAGALVLTVITSRAKMHDLRDLGDRAEHQLQSALSFLPPDAHDVRLLLLFPDHPFPDRHTYSVYLMSDELLLAQPSAPNWLRPGRNITTQTALQSDPSRNRDDFDLILQWNPATQRFQKTQDGSS